MPSHSNTLNLMLELSKKLAGRHKSKIGTMIIVPILIVLQMRRNRTLEGIVILSAPWPQIPENDPDEVDQGQDATETSGQQHEHTDAV